MRSGAVFIQEGALRCSVGVTKLKDLGKSGGTVMELLEPGNFGKRMAGKILPSNLFPPSRGVRKRIEGAKEVKRIYPASTIPCNRYD